MFALETKSDLSKTFRRPRRLGFLKQLHHWQQTIASKSILLQLIFPALNLEPSKTELYWYFAKCVYIFAQSKHNIQIGQSSKFCGWDWALSNIIICNPKNKDNTQKLNDAETIGWYCYFEHTAELHKLQGLGMLAILLPLASLFQIVLIANTYNNNHQLLVL